MRAMKDLDQDQIHQVSRTDLVASLWLSVLAPIRSTKSAPSKQMQGRDMDSNSRGCEPELNCWMTSSGSKSDP